jgi:hypothetical protein
MYQSCLFAKQKNILSKYKDVASLATTKPDDTLSKKLLPFVSTVMSYASDFSSAGPSISTETTRATATGQGRITTTAAGSTTGSTTQRNANNASGSGSDNEEGEPGQGEEHVFRNSYTRKCKLRTVLFLPDHPTEEVAEHAIIATNFLLYRNLTSFMHHAVRK